MLYIDYNFSVNSRLLNSSRVLIFGLSLNAVPSLSSSLRFFNNDCSFACSSFKKDYEIKIEYLFPIYSGSYIFKLGARASIFSTGKTTRNFTRVCLGRVFASSNFPSRRKDEISIEFNPKFSKALRISFLRISHASVMCRPLTPLK